MTNRVTDGASTSAKKLPSSEPTHIAHKLQHNSSAVSISNKAANLQNDNIASLSGPGGRGSAFKSPSKLPLASLAKNETNSNGHHSSATASPIKMRAGNNTNTNASSHQQAGVGGSQSLTPMGNRQAASRSNSRFGQNTTTNNVAASSTTAKKPVGVDRGSNANTAQKQQAKTASKTAEIRTHINYNVGTNQNAQESDSDFDGGSQYSADVSDDGYWYSSSDEELDSADEQDPDEIAYRQNRMVMYSEHTHYDVIREESKFVFEYHLTKRANCSWDIAWFDFPITARFLKSMQPFQRTNHFPGMHNLAKKNMLGRHLMRLQNAFPEQYSFFPATYVLPQDFSEFLTQINQKRNRTFIVKPEASCQGKGIFLTRDPETLTTEKTIHTTQAGVVEHMVIQRYMHKPYLIEGYKFDLRIYVNVTGINPLRVYVYQDGLARFATVKYQSPAPSNLNNLCMHLTNYAINKDSSAFVQNSEVDQDGVGSKRSYLWVLKKIKEDFGIEKMKEVRQGIDDIIVKTMCLAQPHVLHLFRSCQPDDYENSICFQILGFDIMIDHKLRPYLIEVNQMPSFATDSPLDMKIKKGVIHDALALLNLSVKRRNRTKAQRKVEMQRRLLGKPVFLTEALQKVEQKILQQKMQKNRKDDGKRGVAGGTSSQMTHHQQMTSEKQKERLAKEDSQKNLHKDDSMESIDNLLAQSGANHQIAATGGHNTDKNTKDSQQVAVGSQQSGQNQPKKVEKVVVLKMPETIHEKRVAEQAGKQEMILKKRLQRERDEATLRGGYQLIYPLVSYKEEESIRSKIAEIESQNLKAARAAKQASLAQKLAQMSNKNNQPQQPESSTTNLKSESQAESIPLAASSGEIGNTDNSSKQASSQPAVKKISFKENKELAAIQYLMEEDVQQEDKKVDILSLQGLEAVSPRKAPPSSGSVLDEQNLKERWLVQQQYLTYMDAAHKMWDQFTSGSTIAKNKRLKTKELEQKEKERQEAEKERLRKEQLRKQMSIKLRKQAQERQIEKQKKLEMMQSISEENLNKEADTAEKNSQNDLSLSGSPETKKSQLGLRQGELDTVRESLNTASQMSNKPGSSSKNKGILGNKYAYKKVSLEPAPVNLLPSFGLMPTQFAGQEPNGNNQNTLLTQQQLLQHNGSNGGNGMPVMDYFQHMKSLIEARKEEIHKTLQQDKTQNQDGVNLDNGAHYRGNYRQKQQNPSSNQISLADQTNPAAKKVSQVKNTSFPLDQVLPVFLKAGGEKQPSKNFPSHKIQHLKHPQNNRGSQGTNNGQNGAMNLQNNQQKHNGNRGGQQLNPQKKSLSLEPSFKAFGTKPQKNRENGSSALGNQQSNKQSQPMKFNHLSHRDSNARNHSNIQLVVNSGNGASVNQTGQNQDSREDNLQRVSNNQKAQAQLDRVSSSNSIQNMPKSASAIKQQINRDHHNKQQRSRFQKLQTAITPGHNNQASATSSTVDQTNVTGGVVHRTILAGSKSTMLEPHRLEMHEIVDQQTGDVIKIENGNNDQFVQPHYQSSLNASKSPQVRQIKARQIIKSNNQIQERQMPDGSKKKVVILKNGNFSKKDDLSSQMVDNSEQPPKFIRQKYQDMKKHHQNHHNPQQFGEQLIVDMQSVKTGPQLDQFQSMTPMNRQSEINQRTMLVQYDNPKSMKRSMIQTSEVNKFGLKQSNQQSDQITQKQLSAFQSQFKSEGCADIYGVQEKWQSQTENDEGLVRQLINQHDIRNDGIGADQQSSGQGTILPQINSFGLKSQTLALTNNQYGNKNSRGSGVQGVVVPNSSHREQTSFTNVMNTLEQQSKNDASNRKQMTNDNKNILGSLQQKQPHAFRSPAAKATTLDKLERLQNRGATTAASLASELINTSNGTNRESLLKMINHGYSQRKQSTEQVMFSGSSHHNGPILGGSKKDHQDQQSYLLTEKSREDFNLANVQNHQANSNSNGGYHHYGNNAVDSFGPSNLADYTNVNHDRGISMTEKNVGGKRRFKSSQGDILQYKQSFPKEKINGEQFLADLVNQKKRKTIAPDNSNAPEFHQLYESLQNESQKSSKFVPLSQMKKEQMMRNSRQKNSRQGAGIISSSNQNNPNQQDREEKQQGLVKVRIGGGPAVVSSTGQSRHAAGVKENQLDKRQSRNSRMNDSNKFIANTNFSRRDKQNAHQTNDGGSQLSIKEIQSAKNNQVYTDKHVSEAMALLNLRKNTTSNIMQTTNGERGGGNLIKGHAVLRKSQQGSQENSTVLQGAQLIHSSVENLALKGREFLSSPQNNQQNRP